MLPHLKGSDPVYSQLWGESGELWSGDSRLPDFSYAGYHCGEEAIPDVPVVGNVSDFGAKGDGVHDDTRAFIDAIEACHDGAIFIPEGRYKITGILKIGKSNLVLRGAGKERTTLYFPKPLNAIEPNWGSTTGGRRTSNYSWSGGFIQVKGDYEATLITKIDAAAKRGDRSVQVASVDGLSEGMRIQIQLEATDQSLVKYLYADDFGDISKSRTKEVFQVVRIIRIVADEVFFDRPLRFDLRMDWHPEVRQYAPTVSEVGIEDVGYEFPVQPYEGHFTELGFNPIGLKGVSDCWVRRIHVQNCDSGFFISANFCTLSEIQFETGRAPDERGRTGHHGYYLQGSDNLITEFEINQRFIHDVSVGHNSVGNVISKGKGIDLTLDHHKHTPYENLFTDIDTGAGERVWLSGGGGALGKHCAARGTFWNIRAVQSIPYPPEVFGPKTMNLVAVQTEEESETDLNGKWFEVIDSDLIQPVDLHEAQLARRLKGD